MGLFSWIFGQAPENRGSMTGMRAKEDVQALPDAFPTVEDLEERFRRSGMFREDLIERFALGAAQFLRNGLSYNQVVEALVRSGEPLPLEQVRALGFPSKYVVGRDFHDGLVVKDLAAARGRLEDLVELTAARAAQLHALRRYEEANVRHVRLVSLGAAKETPLERRFNNRKISIAEAVDLVLSKGEQIRRSTFSAVIVPGEQSV
ncbi:hypothetical protein [Aureimonas glaciei]|nr:hypothetical protein [Aureimonas glaciei]